MPSCREKRQRLVNGGSLHSQQHPHQPSESGDRGAGDQNGEGTDTREGEGPRVGGTETWRGSDTQGWVGTVLVRKRKTEPACWAGHWWRWAETGLQGEAEGAGF